MTAAPKLHTPRKYQESAAQWLSEPAGIGWRGKLLADPPGFGKSLTTLRAFQLQLEKGNVEHPCLVVATTAISRGDWKRQAAKFWPDLKANIMGVGASYQRKTETDEAFDLRRNGPWRQMLRGELGPSVLITNYESLHHVSSFIDSESLLIDAVALDEAHLVKKPGTDRAKLAKFFAARSRLLTLLTGTPVHNRPIDLHNLLNLCGMNKFGSLWTFAYKYFEVRTGDKGYPRIDELRRPEQLRADIEHIVMARDVSEAFGELPPRIRQLKYVEVKSDVHRISAAKARTLKDGGVMEAALRAVAKEKLDAAVELALELNEPTVLFTYTREDAKELCGKLNKAKLKSVLATGDVTAAKRDEVIESWKRGESQCLVCTMDAVRESATLTRASVTIFADLTPVPATILQNEGRTDPSRQAENDRRPARYLYLVVAGGADELLAETLVSKITDAEGVLGKKGEASNLNNFLSKATGKEALVKMSAADLLSDLVARLDAQDDRFSDLGMF